MKNFLNKYGLIIGLSLLLVIIFVFGGMYSRFMTNQIDVHEQERYEEKLIALVADGESLQAFDSAGADVTYPVPPSDDTYQPELIEAYKVLDENNQEVAMIYVIETYGNADGLRAAYAISLENDMMLGVEVISHNETVSVENQYFNKLGTTFFNRFKDKDMDVIDFSVDSISGATYSSQGLETGMKYARELYAADTDFEIISVILEINSFSYNFDLTTMNDYPFVAEITFGEDNLQATIGVDNDFNYLETISGTEPTETVKEALSDFIERADLMNTQVKIQSYDDITQTVRITVNGYSTPGITMDIELNATLDQVDNLVYVDSTESYENSYTYGGSGVPAIETDYIDQYNTDGTIIDAFSGATVTSNAMREALEWVDQFEASLNGGN